MMSPQAATFSHLLVIACLLGCGAAQAQEAVKDDYKLPPQITPAIRAACEADVRALCISLTATEASVVRCVKKKFDRLDPSCQSKLMAAGLIDPS
jgi:hypothetical protein